MTKTVLLVLEYLASGLSILGAEFLSRRTRYTPWGWLIWLVSNVAFIAFAYLSGHWGILLMQVWFMKTSIVGIKNYLIPVVSKKQTTLTAHANQ